MPILILILILVLILILILILIPVLIIGSESRVITSYVVANPGANPAVVVSPDFVTLPTSGATYEIYSPTKEYLLFGGSFTVLTDNVEEPIYRAT